MVHIEEDKACFKILYLTIRLWTTETCEWVPWQRRKKVWNEQPYHEAA